MTELDRILGEAQDTRQLMRDAIRYSGEGVAHDIVSLRTRLTSLIVEMMAAIKTDSRLQADAEIAREFEARFFEMRQTQAQHHGKWRTTSIEQDPASHRRETEEMGRRHDEFYDWAKSTLSSLSPRR